MSKAKANNWTKVAAKNILKDLGDRRGIGNELDACDSSIIREITKTIEGIITKAHAEATDDANTTFP